MSTANQNPSPGRGPLGSSAWVILLGALVACITVAEAVLLELGATFFTGGFNYPNLDTAGQVVGFFLASLTLDAFLVLAVWLVAIPFYRRFAYGPFSCFVFTAMLSLAIPAVADLLRYRLFAVRGFTGDLPACMTAQTQAHPLATVPPVQRGRAGGAP